MHYGQFPKKKADQANDENTSDSHSTDEQPNPLRYLNATEQSCIHRSISLLHERMRDNLLEVWLVRLRRPGRHVVESLADAFRH
jgi:hypothetical protein